jgi:choline dehydrogenase-like flavoprotein
MSMIMKLQKSYENIIIGSGFGGAFAAYNLARAGKETLLIERGKWVTRDDSCWDEVRLHLKDPMYRGMTPCIVDQKKGGLEKDWPDDTVGGMSTFYGAVALRMREDDFNGAPLPSSSDRDSVSAWPFKYGELAPYYDEAERLQQIAGSRGEDTTEPERLTDYPYKLIDILSTPSRKIWEAAVQLGLNPFRLPMAINFSGAGGRQRCILCSTCDHFICKIEAKNDLAVTVLPEAQKHGAAIIDNHRVIALKTEGNRVTSVELIDQDKGESITIKTKRVIVAAGALATPHLLLCSGIQHISESGALIGRYLMRHANGFVSGIFPYKTNPEKMLQKQVGIPDFYYGSTESGGNPPGPWGMIQDVSSIGKGVIKEYAPWGLKHIAAFLSDYIINQLCIAEDIPQHENRVYADRGKIDRFGMPLLMVYHRYHQRDIEARHALYRMAKKILRKAGALLSASMPIETFSHAFGTCRFGTNKATSALNPECRVWGIQNLYVLDASFMPSGGSVNPSLTIAANSLRVSEILARS